MVRPQNPGACAEPVMDNITLRCRGIHGCQTPKGGAEMPRARALGSRDRTDCSLTGRSASWRLSSQGVRVSQPVPSMPCAFRDGENPAGVAQDSPRLTPWEWGMELIRALTGRHEEDAPKMRHFHALPHAPLARVGPFVLAAYGLVMGAVAGWPGSGFCDAACRGTHGGRNSETKGRAPPQGGPTGCRESRRPANRRAR
jgi:hypothetical protein